MKYIALIVVFLALAFLGCVTISKNKPHSDAFSTTNQLDLTIDGESRAKVIENILICIKDSYIFPDTAAKMERIIRERAQRKEYDGITSASKFAKILTEHLREASVDQHFEVRFSYKPIPKIATPIEQENRWLAFDLHWNFGFRLAARLGGNIGYLALNGFATQKTGATTVSSAMGFLSNTDALIIDLRRNGGGDPSMVAFLTSYFFSKKVHLNDLYWRKANRTDSFWTDPSVPGKQYLNKDIYILTSKRTFSAGEEFCYNLKNLKRAIIIGETTRGAANPVERIRLDNHFEISVPSGRAINPITKTNWEGVGVTPDIAVSEGQALKVAYQKALDKLVAITKDEVNREEIKNALKTIDAQIAGMNIDTL